jgi:hypothetical protein
MFNRVIKTSIRKLSHTHNSSERFLLRSREVTSERIKELERIIETQSNTIKDMEFETQKRYADGLWTGIVSGMIVMFGLRIVDDFTVSNRRKSIEIDIKKEIPPL